MKKTVGSWPGLLSIVAVTSLVTFSQDSPYVRKGSIGKVSSEGMPTISDPTTFRPISKWQGERFIFLPQPKSLQRGYSDFRDLSYARYVGRIAKVIKVVEDGISTPTVYFKMEDSDEVFMTWPTLNKVKQLAPVADLDSSRAQYIGKMLWCLCKELLTYDEDTGKYGSVKIKNLSPVKVTDVIAGWRQEAPVRLVLQTPAGAEGFIDVSISGTNADPESAEFYAFAAKFLTEDPKLTYKWPGEVWSAIANGKVFIGMTDEQVGFSWGRPHRVAKSADISNIYEVWNYSGGVLSFKNGVLSYIQQ